MLGALETRPTTLLCLVLHLDQEVAKMPAQLLFGDALVLGLSHDSKIGSC